MGSPASTQRKQKKKENTEVPESLEPEPVSNEQTTSEDLMESSWSSESERDTDEVGRKDEIHASDQHGHTALLKGSTGHSDVIDQNDPEQERQFINSDTNTYLDNQLENSEKVNAETEIGPKVDKINVKKGATDRKESQLHHKNASFNSKTGAPGKPNGSKHDKNKKTKSSKDGKDDKKMDQEFALKENNENGSNQGGSNDETTTNYSEADVQTDSNEEQLATNNTEKRNTAIVSDDKKDNEQQGEMDTTIDERAPRDHGANVETDSNASPLVLNSTEKPRSYPISDVQKDHKKQDDVDKKKQTDNIKITNDSEAYSNADQHALTNTEQQTSDVNKNKYDTKDHEKQGNVDKESAEQNENIENSEEQTQDDNKDHNKPINEPNEMLTNQSEKIEKTEEQKQDDNKDQNKPTNQSSVRLTNQEPNISSGNMAQPRGDDPKLNANLRFYQNKNKSRPFPGHKIEEMLKWFGDFKQLEKNHRYIQWLFPLYETSSYNSDAQALQPHEAEEIQKDDSLKKRVMKAFKMMLNFYGMELKSENPATIGRAKKIWEERFEHLNKSYHNYLRITRIIRSIGYLGYQHLQYPWVKFLLQESHDENTLLPNLRGSNMTYWIESLISHEEQEDAIKLWTMPPEDRTSSKSNDGETVKSNTEKKTETETTSRDSSKSAEKDDDIHAEIKKGSKEMNKQPQHGTHSKGQHHDGPGGNTTGTTTGGHPQMIKGFENFKSENAVDI